MKRFLIVSALVLVSGTAFGEDAAPQPRSAFGSPQSDTQAEVVIRKIYADFTAAWNRHDVPAMAKMWAVDGDQVEPDGRHAKGRADVEKLLKAEHETVFKDTVINLSIESVWFITEDVALIDGHYDLAGVKDESGKDISIRKGHLTSVLMKDGSTWTIAASRAMIPVPLVWRAK